MDSLHSGGIATVFSAEEIAASGSATSEAINLQHATNGLVIQSLLAGDGEASLTVLHSVDGTNFVSAGSATLSSFTKTSGNDSNGRSVDAVTATPALWIKLKWTETGGANTITVSNQIWAL